MSGTAKLEDGHMGLFVILLFFCFTLMLIKVTFKSYCDLAVLGSGGSI